MKITVNGQSMEVPDGSNVSVINGVVLINGSATSLPQPTTLVIEGNVGEVRTDTASVTVKGSVTRNVTAGGSVSCGDIQGNVSAGGSVSCDDVGGGVSCSGSVSCDDIRGSVKAGGSINRG